MSEARRRPKVVKLSPRAMRKLGQERAVSSRLLKDYVAGVGGEAAFRKRMEALAASHGSTYGLPKIHRGKTFKPEAYFEREVPMRRIHKRIKHLKGYCFHLAASLGQLCRFPKISAVHLQLARIPRRHLRGVE